MTAYRTDGTREDERRGPRDDLSVADVLGIPLVPPGPATRVGNRFRSVLARSHRATAPPPARLLEGVLGMLDLAALSALCRLDLPDLLERPVPLTRLAADLDLDPDRLGRLLRYAATRGWLRIDRRGRVRPTRVTAFLRRTHPGGWRAWIEFAAGQEISGALARLDEGLRPDGDAFAAANGSPFFDWMRTHPQRHASFDAAMAAGGRMHGLLLSSALDWSSTRRVCDVGGGDGALLGILLAHHPHLEGVLLDLPDVVARAPRRDRLSVVAGDAFAGVPPDCDTYLFVNVLHDWDDLAARRLLSRAADALFSNGTSGTTSRVVIVDGLAHGRPRDDVALRSDLLMLALTPGGHERTTDEFRRLAAAAGLRLERSHDLASGDAAHVLTRLPAR